MTFNSDPGIIRQRVLSTLLAVTGFALGLFGTPASAVTIAWGNAPFDTVLTSEGDELSQPPFLFQLGVFRDGFIPTEQNVAEWASKWVVFDESGYNNIGGDPPGPVLDVFYSEARYVEYVGPDDPTSLAYVVGGSASDAASADKTYIFAQQQAYIWIRNDTNPVPGTEWFLATAPSWVFPTPSLQCCDNGLALNWEVQDLGTLAPVFGAQGEHIGGGYASNPTSSNTIQTYTFIPEPSSALLTVASALVFLRRRRKVN